LEEIKQEFRNRDPIEQLVTKKNVRNKREAKQLEKERQMMLLKHVHKLKPAEIAKKLRVSVEDVYRAERRLKVNFKKAKEAGKKEGSNQLEYFYENKPFLANRLEVIDAVEKFVEAKGLNNLTRAKIAEGVRPALRNIEGLADKRLHPDDVSKILKEDLNLRYLRYNSAMVRYQDPPLMKNAFG
jgi:hypothetical protein